MEEASFSVFCNVCKTTLRRQVLGSNIFYYCRNCGSVSSEICVTKEINAFLVQEPLSIQKAPSSAGLKFSEDAQNAMVEN